jgi:hypothetical protein
MAASLGAIESPLFVSPSSKGKIQSPFSHARPSVNGAKLILFRRIVQARIEIAPAVLDMTVG